MPLIKKHYRQNEKIQARLLNAPKADIQISLKYNGQLIPVPIERKAIDGDLLITLSPPRIYQPGKFRLEVSDSSQIISSEEFHWGVLSINTDKSTYLPQDTAQISFTVADDQGTPICDAHLSLKIQIPKSESSASFETVTLKTEDNSITVNPACQKRQKSQQADYQTSIKLVNEGTYQLNLVAKIKNGHYQIEEKLEVRNNLPFEIERQMPIRIYTPEKYPVLLKIQAHQDFVGQIIETVPEDLAIILPEQGQKFDQVKILAQDEDENIPSTSAVLNFSNPYTGSFRQTLAFGQNVTDTYLKRQYLLFGLIGHDGVDFALPVGTPVIASDDGLVIHSGWAPYGNTVIIKHPWGQTYYGHLSRLIAQPNQYVSKGELIGLSGQTGLATGPHLHFSIRFNNYDLSNGYYGKVDPLLYLNTDTIVSNSSIKQIIWNVDLKSGQSTELGYIFNAPDISPRLYLLGPLNFATSDSSENSSLQSIFAENREWQLLADTLPIKLMDITTGTIEDATSASLTQVSTNSKVIAAYNQLYLAAIATSPHKSVDQVAGLGLIWHRITSQCSSNNSKNLSLFWALGSPTDDSHVTARLNNQTPYPGAAAISVYRYSGADPKEPIGHYVSANTSGTGSQRALCHNQQQESDKFSLDLFSTSQENSLVFVAQAVNQENLAPGQFYSLKNQLRSGNGNNSVGLAVQDQSLSKIEKNLPIEGSLNSPADWSLVAVEIIADQNKPKNIMRHGKWFRSDGVKQPFTF